MQRSGSKSQVDEGKYDVEREVPDKSHQVEPAPTDCRQVFVQGHRPHPGQTVTTGVERPVAIQEPPAGISGY